MKILIADDDEFSMELMKRKLNNWGYHDILSCSNGLDAYETLELRSEPMIAILDWMMPGKNGNEVFLELSGNETPVLYKILLTAKNTTEDMQYAMDCGAHVFLTKPVDFKKLKETLETAEASFQE